MMRRGDHVKYTKAGVHNTRGTLRAHPAESHEPMPYRLLARNHGRQARRAAERRDDRRGPETPCVDGVVRADVHALVNQHHNLRNMCPHKISWNP